MLHSGVMSSAFLQSLSWAMHKFLSGWMDTLMDLHCSFLHSTTKLQLCVHVACLAVYGRQWCTPGLHVVEKTSDYPYTCVDVRIWVFFFLHWQSARPRTVTVGFLWVLWFPPLLKTIQVRLAHNHGTPSYISSGLTLHLAFIFWCIINNNINHDAICHSK